MQDKADFLLEIGTEEIPASYIPKALEAMKEEFSRLLEKNLLFFSKIQVAGTPRRLALHVSQLDTKQSDQEKEIIGPPKSVAFDENGNPTKAAEGFARKNNCSIKDLTIKNTSRGEYIAIHKIIKGKKAKDILSETIPSFIEKIPFPKTMRWGTEKIRFARPIRWILSLIATEVVPFNLGNIKSGNITYGHRFMASKPIEIENASFELYAGKLKENFCIINIKERRQQVIQEATKAAETVSGKILNDNELIELNTFLTEYPNGICGSFDKKFLSLPAPVLITCMKEHQKYFAVIDENEKLKAHFIAINNTKSPKPELVRKGHERVLGARLSDADFFFKEDTKRPLEEYVKDLAGMVFHKGLGSIFDKAKRLEKLSEYICNLLDLNKEIAKAKRAAYLCKADLCTEMVGEFPTLQGIMGKEYAELSGEDKDVAIAIEEHYLPIRSGGKLPNTPLGTVLSIADKIDNITAVFIIGLKPTGTQDPYALRRQALGILNILLTKKIHISLRALIDESASLFSEFVPEISKEVKGEILEFFIGRFKNELISKGIDYDVLDAAIAAEFDSPYNCYERALALKGVRKQPEFEPISIAFKRVMNILKGFDGGNVDPKLFDTVEEGNLYKAYLNAKEQISPLLSKKDSTTPTADEYKEALLILLGLKPYIDNFFDNVMVMVEDDTIKENRLSLLWAISKLFLQIGNLSHIVTEGK